MNFYCRTLTPHQHCNTIRYNEVHSKVRKSQSFCKSTPNQQASYGAVLVKYLSVGGPHAATQSRGCTGSVGRSVMSEGVHDCFVLTASMTASATSCSMCTQL